MHTLTGYCAVALALVTEELGRLFRWLSGKERYFQ